MNSAAYFKFKLVYLSRYVELLVVLAAFRGVGRGGVY